MNTTHTRHLRALSIGALMLLPTVHPAAAQSESQLRSFFEGRTVVVKLEMPGAAEGVDVYPDAERPVDFPKHASRLKRFGTAYRAGDHALVSRVKVKGDLIEFQLGGGGYGTFGDGTSTPAVFTLTPKTEREKNLEQDLKRTTDPVQRRSIREELDALRRDREREDVRNHAEAQQILQNTEAHIRLRRAEAGSRFNIRYKPVVPPEALTPEAVMRVLDRYLDFTRQ